MHAKERTEEYIKNKETANGKNIILDICTREKGWRLELCHNKFLFQTS